MVRRERNEPEPKDGMEESTQNLGQIGGGERTLGLR